MSSSVAIKPPPGFYKGPDYLQRSHFMLALAIALLLHFAAVVAWVVSPKTQIVDVPVRTLNVKLGDADIVTPEEMKALQPVENNNQDIENTISHLVRDQDPQVQARDAAMAHAMDKAMNPAAKPVAAPKVQPQVIKVAAAAPTPNVQKQFVRENTNTVPIPHANGSGVGNSSKKEADMTARYEQLISLWILKFKLYPEDARSQAMQGETMVRIRIDRHGNIHYYALEHSTGYQLLDRAAIDMIRRANPVPAAPTDYPAGEMFEFLIPVSFYLK